MVQAKEQYVFVFMAMAEMSKDLRDKKVTFHSPSYVHSFSYTAT